jgi:hypothetical protein
LNKKRGSFEVNTKTIIKTEIILLERKDLMGGAIMKKLSLFITAILIMSFIIIPTNFVQATSMDEIIKSVEQTNMQINEEIEKAVYAAQEALDDYNYDLMVLQRGKELGKIDEELSELRNDLKNMEVRIEKRETVLKRIEKSTEKRNKIEGRYENNSLQLKYAVNELILDLNIAAVDSNENTTVETKLRKTFEEYNKVSSKNYEEIQKLEDIYIAEIERIINELLKVTNKMAERMIEDAAKEGVTVYCEWVEVTLGGRNVLVDPLRIGNF